MPDLQLNFEPNQTIRPMVHVTATSTAARAAKPEAAARKQQRVYFPSDVRSRLGRLDSPFSPTHPPSQKARLLSSVRLTPHTGVELARVHGRSVRVILCAGWDRVLTRTCAGYAPVLSAPFSSYRPEGFSREGLA